MSNDVREIRFRISYEKWNAGEVAGFQPHIAERLLSRTFLALDDNSQEVQVPIAVEVMWDHDEGKYVNKPLVPIRAKRVQVHDEDTGDSKELELVRVDNLVQDPEGVIQDAIIQLVDVEDAWTSGGVPKIEALTDLLGFKVGAMQRDAIWEAMQPTDEDDEEDDGDES